MKRIWEYFARGLLFLFPIGTTLLLIVLGVKWIDRLLNPLFQQLFSFYIPGLGFIVFLLFIILVGYLVEYIGKPFDYAMDGLFSRMPLVKIVYTGLKDFSEAFIGEKRKFTEAVLVKITENGLLKMGFVTHNDLEALKLKDMVSVYFPHSYNFSGNMLLVHKANIIPVTGNSTELMKFIVSAGVTSLDNLSKEEPLQDEEIIKTKELRK